METADEHDRYSVGLAAREIGRRRDLVGDGDTGRAKLVADPVTGPAKVEDRRDAGDADCDVGRPLPKRPAERILIPRAPKSMVVWMTFFIARRKEMRRSIWSATFSATS